MAIANYRYISDAINFYTKHGYYYIDVPWLVPEFCINATMPPNGHTIITEKGCLVGSAEQSFVYMETMGQLPLGKFVGVSPCFRPMDKNGPFNRETFIKVELYINKDVDVFSLEKTIEDASLFFEKYSALNSVQRIETNDGYDLLINDIEVGSYGIRKYLGKKWIYGTGIAEPRFSMAIGLDE